MTPHPIALFHIWRAYWYSPVGRRQIIFTFALSLFTVWFNTHYLAIFELRHGVSFDDRLLKHLSPIDCSIPIFFSIYSVLFIGVYYLLDEPFAYIKGVQAYALMMILRTISIYFTPLEAPEGMITLIDPIGEILLNSHGKIITKDLFFSGHTATVFIFYFTARNRYVKWYVAANCVLVPIMLLWQHVHFTTDVIAAPVVAYFCVKAVDKIYSVLFPIIKSKIARGEA